MRVLVADDEASIRSLLRRCLERLGCNVEVFDNGEALLEASRRLRPQMIISDIDMPGPLNGIEACRAIRSELRGVAIILITGNPHNLPDDPSQECDLYLIKPFPIARIEKAVLRRLKRKG